MIHVGFTGTQAGMTFAQRMKVRELLQYKEFYGHHGDCEGADRDFVEVCRVTMGCLGLVIHPPDNVSKRAYCPVVWPRDAIRDPAPYLVRNRDIVRESDIMIATPKEVTMQLRSGTWATIRECRKAGKPLAIVFPNGGIAYDGATWP